MGAERGLDHVINIGIWREGADFQQQIGRFIDNSRPASCLRG
jgi:hypothetical protein